MAIRATSERFVELAPMATVKTASIMAGSARAAIVISRLPPRPPNELPVSSPPSARKKRPNPSRYTMASTPPNRLSGASAEIMGIIRPAISVVVKST